MSARLPRRRLWNRRRSRPASSQKTWWFVLSPAAGVIWSSAVALIAFLFPRGYYEQLIWETNYVHFNLWVLAYVTLCVTAFAVGYGLHQRLAKPSRVRKSPEQRNRHERSMRILLLIGVCIFLLPISIYALVSILSTVPVSTILNAMLGRESSLVLRQGATQAFGERNIGFAFLAVASCVPWLIWNALDVRASRRRDSPEAYVAVALVCGLLLVTLFSAFLVQSRGQLLYPVFTAILAWTAFRMRQGRIRPKTLLPVGMGALIFALGYFSVISITRSQTSSGLSYALGKLVGYTVGSYNRFAAALDGRLALPGGGGYYWTQGIWNLPGLNGLFGLDSIATNIFGVLPPVGFSERTAYIFSAGLDKSITSFTIFTHSYVDFGWFGFLPFVAYGFLARLAWIGFREGRSWALIIYPEVLWSIVDWRGYIEIARSLPFLALVAAAVGFAELLARRYAASLKTKARPRGRRRVRPVTVPGALQEYQGP